MATAVYVLCAATSGLCAYLLLRGYAASGVRLLLWSGLCFTGLMVNNALLFVDEVVLPDHDLGVARSGSALLAVSVLLYGLVWERR